MINETKEKQKKCRSLKTLNKSSQRVENLRNQQLSVNKENISSDKNISLNKYPKIMESTRVEFIHLHL
jgi:hypothetical protein